jgi:DNA-directed RNA polymerase specialized sigma24 family protein
VAPRAAEGPHERLAHEELLRAIDSALSDLPATYAMAFHLRVREEFSYREMAEICDEPEGTLRSRVHHTLKRLRVALTPRIRPPAERASESRRGDEIDRPHESPPGPDDSEARR